MNVPPGVKLLLLSKMELMIIWGMLLILLALPAGGGAAETNSAMMDDGYIIGPEDVLHISVWKEEELEREVVVRPDGRISFPLAGDVQAAGRTTAAVQREITERLSKYISDPVATVSVKTVSGYKVYVLGKVNNPGEFVVGRYIDVLQALTLAGGLNPYASRNNIKIVRRDKDGKEIVLPFKYGQVKSGKNLEQNIMLKNGDVVVVP
jgi:polysaccharide biosynthesis/export protein